MNVGARIVLCLFVGSALAGCPSAPPSSAQRPSSKRSADVERGAAVDDAGTTRATLDELASRGPFDAPGMQELLRGEGGDALAVVTDRDRCLRASFDAPTTITAVFVDAHDVPRGEAATGAQGWVPPRGPACLRKGETLRLVVRSEAGAPPATRAIVWGSP